MTASLRESGTERELGRATRAGAVGGERLLGGPAPARWGHQAPHLPRPLAPGHSIFCLVLNARRAWTSLSPSGTSAPLQRRARMLRRPSGTARLMTALRMAPLLPAPRPSPATREQSVGGRQALGDGTGAVLARPVRPRLVGVPAYASVGRAALRKTRPPLVWPGGVPGGASLAEAVPVICAAPRRAGLSDLSQLHVLRGSTSLRIETAQNRERDGRGLSPGD